MAKAYFLRGSEYLRSDTATDDVLDDYPKPIANGWSGLDALGFGADIDAAVDIGDGKVYVFKGDQYVTVNQTSLAVEGSAKSIAEGWGGFADSGFADAIDAAINWGNGKAYFFRGDQFIAYDIAGNSVDDASSFPIADVWNGMADAGFGDFLDAGVMWDDGNAYFFKGDQYVRYNVGDDGVAADYPRAIVPNWSEFDRTGFADSINAAWVKIEGSGGGSQHGGSVTGALHPGDHVWYYDGKISRAMDIPRQEWFPGSTSSTDYHGHGMEIFNFVIHADGVIFRGQPHMRSGRGSFAWLNNNPGNMTGVVGGHDYGQYRDKFNWHSFLIFPTADIGFAAIGTLLTGSGYRDLNITQAFERYAPASDGNDPVRYAQDVANAAGVPTATLVRDLNPDQLLLMQQKIREIEGVRDGDVLTRDSADVPEVMRALLA